MKPVYLEKSLGVDIREECVSLVLLGKQWNRVDYLAGETVKIKPLTPGDERAEMFFLDECNKFLMAHDISVRNVAASLPPGLAKFKNFDLPAPDSNVLRSMVGFELEQHFFVGPDRLYYGYHCDKTADNLYNVALTAYQKDKADYYLGLLAKLNIKPTTLDAVASSNINLIAPKGKTEVPLLAVVDISAQSYEISIVKNGILQVSRHFQMKSPAPTETLFDPELPAEEYEPVCQDMANRIAQDLETTFSLCKNISDEEGVEKIYLFGAGYFGEIQSRKIEEATGVPTALPNLPCSAPNGDAETLTQTGLAAAVGLAHREIKTPYRSLNLLPDELKPRRSKMNLKTTLVMATALVVLTVGFMANKAINKNSVLASLNEQLKEIQTQAIPFEKIDRTNEELKLYSNAITQIEQKYPAKMSVLNELTRVVPKTTWLTSIVIKKEAMEIKGFSNAASGLIPLIEASPHFKDATFKGSVVKSKRGEKFTITTALKGNVDVER